MLSIKAVEDALLIYLSPIATTLATKIEILPPDYFERDAEGSALRNRHAFIAFEAKRYNTPDSKGLSGSWAQQCSWSMKIVCTHKELRTHQGLYAMLDGFESALVGVRLSPLCGPIFPVNTIFRKIEANSIWVADFNFSFVETTTNCSKRDFLII